MNGAAARPAQRMPALAGAHDDRLDGLRAISALAVLVFHAGVLGGGSTGVDVFFVLSGFLITGLLAREIERRGRVDLAAFLVRRVRRLVPALAVVIAVYALWSPVLWPRFAATRWLDVSCAVFYLTDFREALATSYSPLSHTWSLAVEAQFYLAWPIVIALLARRSRAWASVLLLVSWALLTAARDLVKIGGWHGLAYYAPPFHASGLVLGAALALCPWRLDRRWIGWIGLAALAAIFLAPIPYRLPLPSGPAFWLIPAAEAATVAVICAPPRVLGWRPLAWLGVISYGVYLWHIPILHLLRSPNGSPERAVTLAALSIVAASLSYLLVERPFHRPRRRPVEGPAADEVLSGSGA